MAIDALPHRIRQMFAAFHTKRQRQLRAVTERERALPRALTQTLKSVPVR